MSQPSRLPLLVIGNKNYSSWSLRPWLLMRRAGIAFEERRIPLYLPESRPQLLRYSPSGKVPALVDGAVTVWDSLAICEYLAEKHPGLQLWPVVASSRAHARSVCAEMHSGFAGLRSQMSMNCRRSLPGRGRTTESLADIERIEALFLDCRHRYRQLGPFLFGRFSVADAMYAPVVLRFVTYHVTLQQAAGDYVQMVKSLPEIVEWTEAAKVEPESIPKFEPA
jgi:glutathione S-transferase